VVRLAPTMVPGARLNGCPRDRVHGSQFYQITIRKLLARARVVGRPPAVAPGAPPRPLPALRRPTLDPYTQAVPATDPLPRVFAVSPNLLSCGACPRRLFRAMTSSFRPGRAWPASDVNASRVFFDDFFRRGLITPLPFACPARQEFVWTLKQVHGTCWRSRICFLSARGLRRMEGCGHE